MFSEGERNKLDMEETHCLGEGVDEGCYIRGTERVSLLVRDE